MTRRLSIAFQTDKIPAEYIALAQLVDQYAFDVVSVYCDAPFHPAYGPLLLMAPHIRRARIGPAAISPARITPIDIAAETALLAGIAAGGVYIGLARGAWLADHGIREPDQPVQAIREAAAIIQLLLSGESGGYEGDVFRLAPHVRAPYPLPDAPVPLLIGTWGRKLGALAGEIADEVKIGGSANPDIIPVMQGYIAHGEVQARRTPGTVGVVIGAVSVIDADRDQARAAARRAVSLYLPVVAPLDPTLEIEPELIARVQGCVNRHDEAGAARLISDALLDRFALSGNPADIIRQSEALFAAGASRIEFGTPHGLRPAEGIRLLGEQVLPALRDARREP
jgi:5,10-methylenetetrahydromethanopterin reductase